MVSPADKMRMESLQIDKQERIMNNPVPPSRIFNKNQPIYVRIDDKKTWTEARVLDRIGNSNTYEIISQGRTIRKHADHMKPRIQPILSLHQGKMGEGDIVRFRNSHNATQNVDQGEQSMLPVPNVDQSTNGNLRTQLSESTVENTPPLQNVAIPNQSASQVAQNNPNTDSLLQYNDGSARRSVRIACKDKINYKSYL